MAGKVKRHVVKTRPAAKPALKMDGDKPHAHRCPTCRERFEDRCKTLESDPECSNCRYGTTWALWRTTRLPQPCCLLESNLASVDDAVTHRLGGQSTWWICHRCKRTHPYEPRREHDER